MLSLFRGEKCFIKYKISAVIHFAAYAYVGESVAHPRKYYSNNLQQTINLFNTMLDNKVNILIFSSSCATYGNPLKIPIKETHPQNPINPYGKTKYMIEEILKDYWNSYGLRFTSLRYFNAAGADPNMEIGEKHDPETHIIPLLIEVALGKRSTFQVFGTNYDTSDGTCIRDYTHVTDLAKAHILALKKMIQGGNSDFFNLGTGKGHSVFQIIKTVEQITKKEINYMPMNRREGDPAILVASNKKAITELGWETSFSDIKNIVQTALNWHLKEWT